MRLGGSGSGRAAAGAAAGTGMAGGAVLLGSFEAVSLDDGQIRSHPLALAARAAARISETRGVERVNMGQSFMSLGGCGLARCFAWIEVDGLDLPLVEIGRVLRRNVEWIAFLHGPYRAFGMRAPS